MNYYKIFYAAILSFALLSESSIAMEDYFNKGSSSFKPKTPPIPKKTNVPYFSESSLKWDSNKNMYYFSISDKFINNDKKSNGYWKDKDSYYSSTYIYNN
jgi:hypothetical protein